jgi:hypothetical protein
MWLEAIFSNLGECASENHKDPPSSMMQRAVFAFMDARPGRIDFNVAAFTTHPTKTSTPIVMAQTAADRTKNTARRGATRSIPAAVIEIHSVLEGGSD